jgi:predicted Kef-type K+ transport protein
MLEVHWGQHLVIVFAAAVFIIVVVVVVVVFYVVTCLFQFHIRQYSKVVAKMFDNSEFGIIIADFIFQRQDTSLNKTKNTSRGQFAIKITNQIIVIQCKFKTIYVRHRKELNCAVKAH